MNDIINNLPRSELIELVKELQARIDELEYFVRVCSDLTTGGESGYLNMEFDDFKVLVWNQLAKGMRFKVIESALAKEDYEIIQRNVNTSADALEKNNE